MSYGAGSLIGSPHSSGTQIGAGLNPSFRQTRNINSMSPNYFVNNGTGRQQAIRETSHNHTNNLLDAVTGVYASGLFDLSTHYNYNKKNIWPRIQGNNFYQENYADFSAKGFKTSSSDNFAKFTTSTSGSSSHNNNYFVQSYKFFTTDKTKYRIFIAYWISGPTAFVQDLAVGAINVVDPNNGDLDYRLGPNTDNSGFLSCRTSKNSSNWNIFEQQSVISTGQNINNAKFRFDKKAPTDYTNVIFGNTTNQWNVNNETQSPDTGPNTGISIGYGTQGGNLNFFLPSRNQGDQTLANGNEIQQTSQIVGTNTNFLYFEASSPTAQYDIGGFHTPRFTLKPNKCYSLRIAYHLVSRTQANGGSTGNTMWAEVIPVQETYRT